MVLKGGGSRGLEVRDPPLFCDFRWEREGGPSGSGAERKGARLKPIGGGGAGVNLRGLVRGAGGAEPGGLRAVRTRRLGGGSPPAEDSSSGEEDGGGRGRGGGSDSESGGDDEDQPPPLL